MKQRIVLPFSCDQILQELERNKHTAYVVGGCVRDSLLGKEPHDWDICTSAKPEEVCTLFRAAGRTVIETGIKHGTVTVLTKANKPYEITTYRVDGIYSDNRHPDNVSFTKDLIEDLSRRDFTINAMAYNTDDGLIDPYGGESDLRMGILRCVGEADARFQEDALRILRALRFASTYYLTIEKETSEAIHRNRELLKEIAAERIRDELCKLLTGDKVASILKEYRDVFAVIIPELELCFDFQQNSPWHCYDVWEHTVETVDNVKPTETMRMIALLHDIGKPHCYAEDENGIGHFHGHPAVSAKIAEEVLHRLRFDNDSTELILKVILHHDTFMEISSRAVRRMLNKLDASRFAAFLDLRYADIMAQSDEQRVQRLDKVSNLRCIASRILTQKHCFSLKDLAINGHDLIQLGMKPGKDIGIVLNRLLDEVLENPDINTKEVLLKKAKAMLNGGAE